jgi:hypothetical protein
MIEKFTNVEVDINDKILFNLMLLAHKENITLNKLCNNIIKKYLENQNGLV